MLNLAIFSGNKIDGGDLVPGERVFGLSIFGALEVDLTTTEDPLVDLVLVAVFGGVTVKVLPNQPVRMGGFSIFGGREVAPRRLPAARGDDSPARPDGSDELPLEVAAYSLFGGISVEREFPAKSVHPHSVAG